MPPTIRSEGEQLPSEPARPTSSVFSSLQASTPVSYPNFVPAQKVHVQADAGTAPALESRDHDSEEEDEAELQSNEIYLNQRDDYDEEADAALFHEESAKVTRPPDPRIAILRSVEVRKTEAQSTAVRLGVRPILKKRLASKQTKKGKDLKQPPERTSNGKEVAKNEHSDAANALCTYSSSEDSDG